MSPVPRVRDLEIEQDLAYQRREWAFERVGWLLLGLLLLAALVGLLGRGPLSNTTAGDPGGPLRVEYQRFLRHRSTSTLRVHLGPNAARGNEAHLWLDREYLEGMEV